MTDYMTTKRKAAITTALRGMGLFGLPPMLLLTGCAPQAEVETEAATPIAAAANSAPAPVASANLPDGIDIGGAFMPDFSYAGYGFGLEPLPDFAGATVIDVTDHAVVADDGEDDSAGLLAALDAADAVDGPVIIALPAGRIEISEIIPITRSDLVLRGAGETATELHMPRPLSMIDTKGKFEEIHDYLVKYEKFQREPKRNINLKFSDYSWTGGFIWIAPEDYRSAAYLEELDRPDTVLAEGASGMRGSLSLRVDDASKLVAGDDIELVWYSRDGEDGGIIDALYGDTDLKVGSHHWSFPNRGLVRQKTEIASIDGTTVTLADPLLHPVSDAVPASLVDWQPLRNVGIEDLSITFPDGISFGHHLEQGFNAVYFGGLIHGWMRDITIDAADSGVLSYSSANLTLDNVTTTGAREAHYSIHAGNVHNVLVSDLSVRNRVRHPLTVNTQSTKTVFLRSEVLQQPTLDQHAGANHQNLFDQTVFHLDASDNENGRAAFPVWNGSGAGYWQPGHGQFNTTYNLELRARSGVPRGQALLAEGTAEGPEARLIGVWGNRDIEIDYRPAPVTALIGERPATPSLYEWQLAQRRAKSAP